MGLVLYDPEYTTNYELAYRSESTDDSRGFNANAFYTQWIDHPVDRFLLR